MKDPLDELAQALFDKMETLDPSGLGWSGLSESERLMYRASVGHLLRHNSLDAAVASVRLERRPQPRIQAH